MTTHHGPVSLQIPKWHSISNPYIESSLQYQLSTAVSDPNVAARLESVPSLDQSVANVVVVAAALQPSVAVVVALDSS